jgi:hypothetical protein
MIVLRNYSGDVLQCEEGFWAAAVSRARSNGWDGSDESAEEINAGDADALADAIEDGAGDLEDDVGEMVQFLRRGGVRILWPV